MISTDKATSKSDGEQNPAMPSISLPKGGGAARGIGEKFAANPVTGTGSMSVPIATSSGRAGFGPQHSLSYDSGAGSGPFGLGWNLQLPSITRTTDKGLPKYRDAEESDVFILSGAEDLVPVLGKIGNVWVRESPPTRKVSGVEYRIRAANRYLKRIRYGNRVPYLPELSGSDAWPAPPGRDDPIGSNDWLFEVIFDSGETDANAPTPNDAGAWGCRNDPFSAYRAGFEVRTYRLCQRVLMFHHFEREKDIGENCLVRSTNFTYSFEENPADARNPVYSQILSATHSGYKRQGAA